MAGGYGGGGAPSVETVLNEPHCRPGGVVAGKVHLRGGTRTVDIRHVTLALMPRMQNGHGGETAGPEVYRGALTRAFRLEAGQSRDLAFSIPLPYELPFTTVLGRELPGFTIGLCTEVDVKGEPDPGDVDPISVEPLQSQQWVLAAIARLGFKIKNVTFQQSKLRGLPQQLPFHQEIHLSPPPQFQGRLAQVGLTFVASPRMMGFKLRAEGRTGDEDAFGAFTVPHPEAAETDWNAKISQWLEQAVLLPHGSSGGPAHGTPAFGAQAPVPPPGAQTPLPPPGGHGAYPPPPGQHQQHAPGGQGQFPPPAPAPGQHAPMPPGTPVPYAPAAHGGQTAPPPSYPPPPGHPQHGHPTPPPPQHGQPASYPPPGHGYPAPHSHPAPGYPQPGYPAPHHHAPHHPGHGAAWGA
ncbi:sporulation protein, partial [Actinomadura kijaniata]|uniref:sporulation protein n=1 Tax=Actinomadura kijaniata TaxID=46161 RepID=UPI0031D378D3